MKSNVAGRWRRHHTTARERARWIERLERSGLSRRAFAQRHQLGYSTLQRWLGQSRTSTTVVPPPPLREVSLGQVLGQPQWIAEVQRPDGLTVRLSAAALPLVATLLTPQPC